ncbi:MAG: hypothetical protein H8M99_12685 [Gloeobacteraceae cyanobacterium ES-bin-144]|nr:hypothetical protein [Verrucomicrobiales bacterium]
MLFLCPRLNQDALLKLEGSSSWLALADERDWFVMSCTFKQNMGDQYAQMLREMALAADVQILLGNRTKDGERILCVGAGVHSFGNFPEKSLLLLAPEKLESSELLFLTSRRRPSRVILPEIDEDGRVGFWDEITQGTLAANIEKTTLSGVGNRVDWAWPEVIALVKNPIRGVHER